MVEAYFAFLLYLQLTSLHRVYCETSYILVLLAAEVEVIDCGLLSLNFLIVLRYGAHSSVFKVSLTSFNSILFTNLSFLTQIDIQRNRSRIIFIFARHSCILTACVDKLSTVFLGSQSVAQDWTTESNGRLHGLLGQQIRFTIDWINRFVGNLSWAQARRLLAQGRFVTIARGLRKDVTIGINLHIIQLILSQSLV